MADLPSVHYGPQTEYYYKENGQWFQKSSFFVNTFLKKSEEQVPKEYLDAEAKREKRLSISSPYQNTSSSASRLISIVSREESAVQKRTSKDDNDRLVTKNSKLQSRMDAQKQIMDLKEEDAAAAKPERVKTGKPSTKNRLAWFDERSKNRGLYFAEVINKSTECENRPETQELVQSSNKNRVIRGQVAYCSAVKDDCKLSEDDFFHVINSYQFLTVNTSRSSYFDANGCVYCAEHGSLSAHTPEVACPHIHCACVRCFAQDLVKPDGL